MEEVKQINDIIIEQEELFEMANFRQSETGLNRIIWVSPRSGREKHSARIKVQNTTSNKVNPNNWVSVSISGDPKVVAGNASDLGKDWQQIKAYIILNKSILMKYWNGNATTTELIQGLRQLP